MSNRGLTISIIDTKDLGEETTFGKVKIGQMFREQIYQYEDGKKIYTFSCSVKTGKKSSFNMDYQRGKTFKDDQKVIRIHEVKIVQPREV